MRRVLVVGGIARIVAPLLRPWRRVRMRRREAQGEAAYAAMYEARPPAAKDCYDDSRRYFHQAIDIAEQAGLAADAARLTSRRDEIAAVYNRQFRRVGYN